MELASLVDWGQNQSRAVVAPARAWLSDLSADPELGGRFVLLAAGWLVLLWMFRMLDNGCRPWPMAVERLLDVGTAPVLVLCAVVWPLMALSLGCVHATIGAFHRRATPALRLQLHRWRVRAGDRPDHRR